MPEVMRVCTEYTALDTRRAIIMTMSTPEYRVHCRIGFGLPSDAEKLGDSANSVLGFDK